MYSDDTGANIHSYIIVLRAAKGLRPHYDLLAVKFIVLLNLVEPIYMNIYFSMITFQQRIVVVII